ncbi:MAG: glycosyltransferase family 4 protein [Anaerolineales bacterium]|nr:glycosyltransferase family 4 protein [Anaerolineales bacterium]MBP6209713.1 glycosyltransferase family 4 protein [Anaerolineales bacterium]
MKIAFLSEKYTPDIGGLAISTERIAQLLATAGHQVRVFSPTQSLPASEKRTLPHHKVSVTRFGAQKHMDDTLVDWFELIVEEHKREPFDLVHAYFLPQAGFVAAYTGKYLNIPSVVSIRGNDIERSAFDPGRFSHVMYALQNASAVTTNAIELAKKAKAFIDRPIHIIPNGVDTDLFKKVAKNNALAKSLGLDEQRFVVGFAGELRSKKGFSTLLLGYTQINKMVPCTLLIVGSVRAGEYQQAFEDFHRNNPDTRIVVTGSVPHKDLPAYYSLMDVFVHPSLRDGMPNAILEAMACELPVVATPVGGIMEVIEDGITGKTVPVRDVATFVKTTINLLRDTEERTRLGKSAREKVLNDYAPEKELRANLEIYQSLK